jgi:hypothetical protein
MAKRLGPAIAISSAMAWVSPDGILAKHFVATRLYETASGLMTLVRVSQEPDCVIRFLAGRDLSATFSKARGPKPCLGLALAIFSNFLKLRKIVGS